MPRRYQSKRGRSSGGRSRGGRRRGHSGGASRSFFRGRKSRSTAGWRWLLTGIVAGALTTGMLYLNEHPLDQWQTPLKVSQAKPSGPGKSPGTPKFEFYQLLAKPTRANHVSESGVVGKTVVAAQANVRKTAVAKGSKRKANARLKAKTKAGSLAATRGESKQLAEQAKRSVSKGGYVLRVASFPHRDGAEQLSKKMRGWGVNARVAAVEVAKKTWYRVVVGPLTTESEAKALRGRMAKRGLQAQISLAS